MSLLELMRMGNDPKKRAGRQGLASLSLALPEPGGCSSWEMLRWVLNHRITELSRLEEPSKITQPNL